MSKISGNDITVGSFFRQSPNAIFSIPKYQRSYAWKEKNVFQWLEDIKKTSSDKKQYFVGPVIYVECERNYRNLYSEVSLLDGQQRITTTYLMYFIMNIIYRELRENDDMQFENGINSILYNWHGPEKTPRLKLNEYDNDYFLSLINGTPYIGKPVSSHKLLKNAYSDIEIHLRDLWDKKGIDGFNEYIVVFSEYFKLMGIQVDDDINAYYLFESMNDKGLKLSQTDLIKNYVFSLVDKSKHDDLNKNWNEILSDVNLAGYDFDTFLMYYWDSKYEEIRKHQVYEKFKEKNTSSALVIEEIDEMVQATRSLFMFIKPQEHDHSPSGWDTGKDSRDEIEVVLHDIKALNVKQFHILIIALMGFHGNENGLDRTRELLIPYFKKIRFFVFSYFTVCKEPANRVLPILCELAQKINNDYDTEGVNPSLEDFDAFFKHLTPNEQTLKRKFMNFKSSNEKSRAILKAAYPAPSPFSYKDDVTQVEHIIPKKWEEHWESYLKTENNRFNKDKPFEEQLELTNFADMLINRIGNHALLFKKDNISVSNKYFDDKVIGYSKSNVPNTKEISNFRKFNLEAINKRAEEIYNLIIAFWKA